MTRGFRARTRAPVAMLVVALMLAACGGATTSPTPPASAPPATAAVATAAASAPEFIGADETREVDGVFYPDWGASGVGEIEVDWQPTVYP